MVINLSRFFPSLILFTNISLYLDHSYVIGWRVRVNAFSRVLDTHFFADPDPDTDKNLHADPDPGGKGKK